ncbi:FKBP-type peptidyl-prolyl cis-trans isomerase [Pseudoclavibacter sp. 13-3]|uniref:FKBP-type peptidyl-prolyl cis-trans isomerase n=1 Tax=Pseudoclavibacter sp. 13-3 TaxID=2901228 RepID=UPI001E3B04CB|nr:FKBP-type peptidyl-prolyl cis-trans isomerase [Pseudoclavibacter sp. 13-3]
MRKWLTAGVIAVTMVGLAGCSNGSNGIDVTGDFGTAAAVSVSGDVDTSKVQTKTLIDGDGDTVGKDDNVELGLALYDPTNQKDLSPYNTTSGLTSWKQYFSSLPDQIDGKKIGTRLSITGSASDLLGAGNASSYFGLDDSDPLAMVVDVIGQVQTSDPELSDTFSDADFPTVTLDDSGNPTTTITTGISPKTTQVKVIKQGDGETVAEGNSVSFHYQLTKLRDGKQVESNYGGDAATSTADETGLIPGFVKALVGQKVGSTVVAVVPPSEAYGSSDGAVMQHETLVFVLTIDSTGPASDASTSTGE